MFKIVELFSSLKFEWDEIEGKINIKVLTFVTASREFEFSNGLLFELIILLI